MQKIASYGDPRLFALAHIGSDLAKSTQPLVPERVFVSGAIGLDGNGLAARNGSDGNGDGHAVSGGSTIATTGLVGLLLQSLLAERTAFASGDSPELASLKELTSRLTRDTLANMPAHSGAGVSPAVTSTAVAATEVKQIAAAN
jgi:hypothetical protein